MIGQIVVRNQQAVLRRQAQYMAFWSGTSMAYSTLKHIHGASQSLSLPGTFKKTPFVTVAGLLSPLYALKLPICRSNPFQTL